MPRRLPHESDWGAPRRAPQSSPLTDGTAGDEVEGVARSAAEALGQPVAIIGPALGAPVVWPADAVPDERQAELVAAAAAVVRLMDDVRPGDSVQSLVRALATGEPADVDALVDEGRRLGFDLATGAVAICARGPRATEMLDGAAALVASWGADRAVGLIPLPGEEEADALCDRARQAGLEVGVSAPRRQPGQLHEAVREAMLLADLASVPDSGLAGQEETYRLLIGVLLRDRHELESLRDSTISSLTAYDAEHDTELLGTLETFLARHGSTTDTAEMMRLHRHTVGYRLSRVQEVSGLSPYESDGRERLSLGLKAAQILAADERLSQPG